MFRLFPLVSVLLLCASCSTAYGLYCRGKIKTGLRTPASSGDAKLDVYGDLPVIYLHGTQEEMGRQYGTLLKEPLQYLNSYMRAFIPEEKISQIISSAKELEKNLPEEIRAEFKAVAEASGVPYDVIAAINLTPRMACSTLAVWGKSSKDGKLIMGRNSDYFGFGLADRGSLIVVYHPAKGKKVLSVNFIGMLGAFTGINEDGVAFGNMLVFNAAGGESRKDGLPIQLLMQMAAHKNSTAEEFCGFLKANAHLIPMNVMAADKTQALVLEAGTEKSFIRSPENSRIAASNYFITAEMAAEQVSCHRYKALLDAVENHNQTFDAAAMENALSHAKAGKDLNLHAVVFEPEDMKMRVSVNKVPAADGPYAEFDISTFFR